MITAVAGKGAVAAGDAGTDVFEPAIGNRIGHGTRVKVDEAGLGSNPVSIVARATGGLLIHDMETMAAVLTLGVRGMEALVTEDAVAVVAFVAECVVAKTFNAAVLENELPLQDWSVNRAVGAVGARVTGGRALVRVVAIGAVDAAGGRERRDQARDDRIFSCGLDRMKGGISRLELKAFIRL